ncbi:putative hydrolase [Streptomyces sp. NBRC 110611]|uniref:HAD family hydrolase n=1 Tax=Streptomyces sp. NBRC 110611 TaxID=1621259 RepID=UPI0008357549|nr:HAD family hydrolase [Streptomyces sp. NBRC 110611]GAU71314.1 putative hydrolase [Streptomyces sp. NBRC 110611]
MGKHATHIVWDWNGTLFHDVDAVIGATNAAFEEIGLEPITLETYRELYCVPVPRFYERLMGRLPTDEEWLVMDEAFHRHYGRHRVGCGLAEGAELLLAEWQAAGRSQSILSMFGHDELIPLVRGFGIESRFVRVEGRTGPSGGTKSAQMVRHLAALADVEPGRTVVVGDAVDDAVAARDAGAYAVLYSGGSHSRRSLEAGGVPGVPVVDSLAEAVQLAGELVV